MHHSSQLTLLSATQSICVIKNHNCWNKLHSVFLSDSDFSEVSPSKRERERERSISGTGMPCWCQNNASSSWSIVFRYTLTFSSIINFVELCHNIMEYGLAIITPGQVCHQFVFFFSCLQANTLETEEASKPRESKPKYRLIRQMWKIPLGSFKTVRLQS